MVRKLILLLFSVSAFSQSITLTDSDIKAFYTAEGAGSVATGGRGGTVIHVTNLNATGPGSLYAAIFTTGARVIVFDVSGSIDMNNTLWYVAGHSYDDITIAGETAPEGGISLYNGSLRFEEVDNIIVRNIRFRSKYTGALSYPNPNVDAFEFEDCENAIGDHISVSYGGDEGFTMNSNGAFANNNTIQRTLYGENKTALIMGTGTGGDEANAGDMSFIKNLISSVGHRYPLVGGNGQYDIINNVNYNWYFYPVGLQSGTGDVNFIGNYQIQGPYGTGAWASANRVIGSNFTIYSYLNYHNILDTTPSNDQQNLWRGGPQNESTAADPAWFTTTQFTFLGDVDLLDAGDAYIDIILNENVGAGYYVTDGGNYGKYTDSYDSQRIDDVLNNTNPSVRWNGESGTWDPDVYWTEFPTIPQNTRGGAFDSDGDGLPDFFETINGGSISPNTRPASVTLVNGTTVNQSGVTNFATTGYTYMDFYTGEIMGDFSSASPASGGGSSAPDGTKNATSAMLISH